MARELRSARDGDSKEEIAATVFVLGAGFTRAFSQSAPLQVDNYDSARLIEQFKPYSSATKILQQEIERNPGSMINIERIMSRLSGFMPYDADVQKRELDMLLQELTRIYVERIRQIRVDTSPTVLSSFARYCVKQSIDCLTFNQDDILDGELWQVDQAMRPGTRRIPVGDPIWHPNGGYSFFCRPSVTCIRDMDAFMVRTSMTLLKLHGSVNWRPKKGYSKPYSSEALVHHENWLDYAPVLGGEVQANAIEAHLESLPLVIPPVLLKSALMEQPVLNMVWSSAYRALNRAKRVVFIGYSLPMTDISASYLFSEAITHDTEVRVVTKGGSDQARVNTKESYRRVFSRLEDSHFEFEDAARWIDQFLAGNL